MPAGLTLLNYLLPGIAFGFAAAVQPGPLMIYLVSQTVQSGWKRTLPAVFAPLISDGPIAVVCLFILSRLPAGFLDWVRMAGGVFLLYLALKTIRTWQTFTGLSEMKPSSSQKTLMNAVVVNFLNPGPYIGWSLVMGPLLLGGWKANPLNGFALIAGFYLTMFAVTAFLVVLVHYIRERLQRMQRTMIGISAILLALLGFYQLLTGAAFL